MSKDARLHWVVSRGGTNASKDVLMIGPNYLGHFYRDPSDGVDVDAAQDEISRRFNLHPMLVEAIEAAEKMKGFVDDRINATDANDRRIADENIDRLYRVIDNANVAVANS